MEPEIKISGETVFCGKIFNIEKDVVRVQNGHLKEREVMKHPGGVVILALNENKIIFVKQYRYGAKDFLSELPAGKFDKPGENPLEAAKRELSEETGYIAEEWKELGFIYTSPAISCEKLYLFLARSLTKGAPHPDNDEFLEISEIEKEKVFNMIISGEITDAKTICAIAKAFGNICSEHC